MKAVILAAGKGTRMRELTNELPKPMLPVHGRPILEHILEGLLGAGIHEVCLVTGWKAEVIEAHFGDGSRFGARITYARQVVQDGTGKAPEYAKDFVGGSDFVLTYGDILVKPETYQQMVARWREGEVGTARCAVPAPERSGGAEAYFATLAGDVSAAPAGAGTAQRDVPTNRFSGLLTVTEGQDVSKGGLNFFDEQFNLTRLVEKPGAAQLDELRATGWLKPSQPVWYNAGIYLFKPLLFDFTAKLQKSPRGEYELTDAISALVAAGHKLAGLKVAGRWVDVRDPEVLAALQT